MSAFHLNRQVCVHCGKRYGTRYKMLPNSQEQWYTKHEPFCTLRCALAYARWVYFKYGHGRAV